MFKYKVINIKDIDIADPDSTAEQKAAMLEAGLDEYGKDGWELVLMNGTQVIFKRKKRGNTT